MKNVRLLIMALGGWVYSLQSMQPTKMVTFEFEQKPLHVMCSARSGNEYESFAAQEKAYVIGTTREGLTIVSIAKRDPLMDPEFGILVRTPQGFAIIPYCPCYDSDGTLNEAEIVTITHPLKRFFHILAIPGTAFAFFGLHKAIKSFRKWYKRYMLEPAQAFDLPLDVQE